MCRYPHRGFPLISHHTPAVIPSLWRGGICHFGCLFPPFLFSSGVKLSSDLLWSFPGLAQSPGLPNYQTKESAPCESDLFLGRLLPRPERGWWLALCFLFPLVFSCLCFFRVFTEFPQCPLKDGRKQTAIGTRLWGMLVKKRPLSHLSGAAFVITFFYLLGVVMSNHKEAAIFWNLSN